MCFCGKGSEVFVIYGNAVGSPDALLAAESRALKLAVVKSHQYNVAARLSDITMCVYMRSAAPHCAAGPNDVRDQSTFLKKRT